MICEKCGQNFSRTVWRIHRERCQGKIPAVEQEAEPVEARSVSVDDIDVIEDMSKDQLIELAEEFGIEVDGRWGKARIIEALEQ